MKFLISLMMLTMVGTVLPSNAQPNSRPISSDSVQSRDLDRQTLNRQSPEELPSDVRASTCQQPTPDKGKEAKSRTAANRYEQAPRLCDRNEPDIIDDRIKETQDK